jgi:uncharacterized membrane protein YgcG
VSTVSSRAAGCKKAGPVAIWLALVLLATIAGRAGAADERILDFHSEIVIHADSSMTVRETIRVRSTGAQIRRGIYRDFPTSYSDRLGNHYVVGFAVTQVTRDAQPEAYHVVTQSNTKRVYIGREGVMLPPGEHTYVLTYVTNRQLGFFADHDELYWNVTGNEWAFPIDVASASVFLPAQAAPRVTSFEAYTGPRGARLRNYEARVGESGQIVFSTNKPLARGEGLTIVVTWPKGLVREPARATRMRWFLRDNALAESAALGLLVLLGYYLFVWYLVGKDPPAGTIIPRFHPPEGFSPAMARHLTRMGYDDKAFAAALIDMAVKGHASINQEGKSYALHAKSGSTASLSREEKKLADVLFSARDRLSLESSNSQTIQKGKVALQDALRLACEKTYFVTNGCYLFPGLALSLALLTGMLLQGKYAGPAVFLLVWLTIWTVGVLVLLAHALAAWTALVSDPSGRLARLASAVLTSLFALPFVAGEVFGLWALASTTSPSFATAVVVFLGVNALFYNLLKAPTRAGRRVLDELEGFRMYLSTAEKDRLNLINPPAETSALFEAYLPWALALDVEQAWANRFASVLSQVGEDGCSYSPTWHSGTGWNTTDTSHFVGSLGDSLASAISSASSPPGSSSGGGGGGSSGGGGGGGGGGGW